MIRHLRRLWWYSSTFLTKYRHTIFISFFIAALVSVVGLIVYPKLPKPKPVSYVGVVGKYTLTQIPQVIQADLGLGLTTLASDLEIAPSVAERWEVLENGTIYRFYLKSGLRWSNGDPVTIHNISLNIPEVEITRQDPNILEFKLPEPFTPFPSVLTKPLIKDGKYTIGDYTVSEIETDGVNLKKITLESAVESHVYKFYPSLQQAVLDFKLGKIDRIPDITDQPSIAGWSNVSVSKETDYNSYVAVFFNLSDPLFNRNKDLRQGLAYAIENKAPEASRALSPVNPRSWYFNKTVKTYDYNPARAEELIGKGMPADAQDVVIELSTTPELLTYAEKIKSDWQKFGVNTEIKVVSSRPSAFQVLLISQPIPVDPDQYAYWHSTQSTNLTNNTRIDSQDENNDNAKIDKLLEDGRQTLDPEERRLIYLDFQRFLVEYTPAVFLYHPTVYSLIRQS